jgi:hypothetical protein
VREGAATVLVAAEAPADEPALRRGWRVLIARPTRPTPPRAPSGSRPTSCRQTGVRAFLIGVQPGRPPRPAPTLPRQRHHAAARRRAVAAARGTTLIVLGERSPMLVAAWRCASTSAVDRPRAPGAHGPAQASW